MRKPDRHQSGAALDAELAEDFLNVPVRRERPLPQLGGNLFFRLVGEQELHHLPFSRREGELSH